MVSAKENTDSQRSKKKGGLVKIDSDSDRPRDMLFHSFIVTVLIF